MNDLGRFLSWVGVALVTLLPIINPVNTAVLLLSISTHLDEKERNRQVTRACIYMTAILLAFLFAGHFIIVAFGISVPGIRIAGGMVIGYLGFRMLFPSFQVIQEIQWSCFFYVKKHATNHRNVRTQSTKKRTCHDYRQQPQKPLAPVTPTKNFTQVKKMLLLK